MLLILIKIMKFKCLLIVLIASLCQCNEGTFEWTDSVSGTKYDFSGLKRDPK